MKSDDSETRPNFEAQNWSEAKEILMQKHKDNEKRQAFLQIVKNPASIEEECTKLQAKYEAKYSSSINKFVS